MIKFSDWATIRGSTLSIEHAACEALLNEASSSPRLRAHRLLHESHVDPVQRLIVAFAKGTYIQPHRHPEQWEMIMPMHGAFTLLLFSDNGTVIDRTELTADTTPQVQIAAGELHTLVPITPHALMLEIKPGPFRPAKFLDILPSEGSPEAARAASWLDLAQRGDHW
ncbi:WbuC family cupin fold metalloprotein [Bradyrhizobium centrosematis]|uniref:WbuC family cupin fold metalloprotein n=1 Tax=Bradyrhizobium centrosematis TaxID=1300039 RepID=UPI0021699155|nr:WbuC family cupin fold metalloprotein [Bradyrhizobium centrosematis]MCS3765343.1 cupin fold WbuC family metalloprotein [Bradyrhizobium centrosematis]MCS3773957.1 cupin fold WbuC family metalloprotein [Bradyrhizobium centrosematis]